MHVIKTKTVITHQALLSGDELIAHLNGEPLLDANSHLIQVPAYAKVSFQVPGGGDWSNETLEVDEDCPICITWEERS